jgi:hypothetical protein
LTYSELHDDELIHALAHDPRTGCLALWSITLVFVVPGLLDHELALLLVGIALGCAAAFASGRHLVRTSARRRSRAPFRPAGAPVPRRERPVVVPCRTTPRPRFRSEQLVIARPCERGQPLLIPGERSGRLPRLRLRRPRRACARSRR